MFLKSYFVNSAIMDVTTPEQARIAEAAGACAVMALERIPADIRAAGGVATPADAALMMQLGAEGVFVGSGIGTIVAACQGNQLVTSFHPELNEDLSVHRYFINRISRSNRQ